MNEYKTTNRLSSDEFIGTKHIAVERHSVDHYPQHWHNYFEIELILSGTASHIYNGKKYTIKKGDVYILTPVDFHGVESESQVELINISFESEMMSSKTLSFLCQSKTPRRLSNEEFERFIMAAKLLEHECNSNGSFKAQFLEYILSCLTPQNIPPSTQAEQLEGIKRAINYIELHFRDAINLKELAKISGYNPSYFSELFKKVTGETYKERISNLRTSYAKMLLANGFSVTDACFASGFGSLSNFCAVFRKKFDYSPDHYRKNLFKTEDNATGL